MAPGGGYSMDSDLQRTEHARLVLPSRVEEAGKVRKLVGSLSRLDGFPEDDVCCIEIAVGEGVANAVRHGSPHGERDTIEVSYGHIEERYIEIVISDHGTGFDLENWLEQVKPLSLSDGERGLFLISTLMDEVTYTRSECGGELSMRKFCPRASPGDSPEDSDSVTLHTRRGRAYSGTGSPGVPVPKETRAA